VILKTTRGSKSPALFKKSIDWFHWKNMRSVDLWQASSLVCGIDPLDNSKHEQRVKIHDLIYSNAGDRAFFSMLYENGYQKFLLSEVAAWCLSIGFQIPDELVLLANTHEKNLNDAPPTDIEPTETTTVPPVQQDVEPSTYQLRNDDFKTWVETEKPVLDEITKPQIHEHLKVRNPQLWSYIGTDGFNSWWEQQNIHKAKRGRKSSRNRIT
jgi:hypothetical protein